MTLPSRLTEVMQADYAPGLRALMEGLAARYYQRAGKQPPANLLAQPIVDLRVAAQWGGVEKLGGYAPSEITAKSRLTIPGAFAFFALLFPEEAELFDTKHVGVNKLASYSQQYVCTGLDTTTVQSKRSGPFTKENIVNIHGVPVCSSLGGEHGGVATSWWSFAKRLVAGNDGAVEALNQWGATESVNDGPFILDVDKALAEADPKYNEDVVGAARSLWDIRMKALADLAQKVITPLVDSQAYEDKGVPSFIAWTGEYTRLQPSLAPSTSFWQSAVAWSVPVLLAGWLGYAVWKSRRAPATGRAQAAREGASGPCWRPGETYEVFRLHDGQEVLGPCLRGRDGVLLGTVALPDMRLSHAQGWWQWRIVDTPIQALNWHKPRVLSRDRFLDARAGYNRGANMPSIEILVYKDGTIRFADGNHRLAAAIDLGLPTIGVWWRMQRSLDAHRSDWQV